MNLRQQDPLGQFVIFLMCVTTVVLLIGLMVDLAS